MRCYFDENYTAGVEFEMYRSFIVQIFRAGKYNSLFTKQIYKTESSKRWHVGIVLLVRDHL